MVGRANRRRDGGTPSGGGDEVAGASGGGGVASGVAGMAVDWVDCGMAGRKVVARARVWLHWRHYIRTDWVGDWGMDLLAVGNCALEYFSIFVGGGDGGGGGAGEHCAFV